MNSISDSKKAQHHLLKSLIDFKLEVVVDSDGDEGIELCEVPAISS